MIENRTKSIHTSPESDLTLTQFKRNKNANKVDCIKTPAVFGCDLGTFPKVVTYEAGKNLLTVMENNERIDLYMARTIHKKDPAAPPSECCNKMSLLFRQNRQLSGIYEKTSQVMAETIFSKTFFDIKDDISFKSKSLEVLLATCHMCLEICHTTYTNMKKLSSR